MASLLLRNLRVVKISGNGLERKLHSTKIQGKAFFYGFVQCEESAAVCARF
jgi:hypothetical protein